MDTITDRSGLRGSPMPTRNPLRIGLLAVAFGAAALAASGALYEAVASRLDATTPPVSGRLIDIGGHRLYLECTGNGSPTVVLDAGLGKSSRDWLLVAPQLSQSSRVCTFDRAGMGWSDPGPLPRSPGRNADELHHLLDAGGIAGPYILVGHSLGGKVIRLFAAEHRGAVAGMVLVDARSERIDLDAGKDQYDAMTAAIRGEATLYTIARSLGLIRLFAPSLAPFPRLQPEEVRDLLLRETAPNAVSTTIDEGAARGDDDIVLATTSLGDIPLVVLAAGETMRGNPGWAAAQEGLAALSSKGRLIVAEQSSHAINIDEPDAVIEAVLSVLTDIRNHD